MSTDEHGYPEGFIRSAEAAQFIAGISNPITKALVNNAHFHLFRRLAEERFPVGSFDMRFFVEVLAEMFSEHDALRMILDGERVGAFFDDEV
jgi:hypothetical protein